MLRPDQIDIKIDGFTASRYVKWRTNIFSKEIVPASDNQTQEQFEEQKWQATFFLKL